MAGNILTTIKETCTLIKASEPKEAQKLAMKLISSSEIEANSFDVELIKEQLGVSYYNHILIELSNKFHIGKKK